MSQSDPEEMTDTNGDIEMEEEKTEPENAEPGEATEPKITRFDDNGDLRLIVSNKMRPRSSNIFLVSSKAMSMACDPWNSMLNGQFKESQPSSSGEREVELPDDHPNALAIPLHIAHLRFDLIPEQPTFSTLLNIAVLSDKYDATHILRPWATSWVNALSHTVEEPGYEEWLWVAWEFGQAKIFEDIATRLVRTINIGPDGKCQTPEGKILDPASSRQYLPPEIIESIMAIREKTVVDLLDIFYSKLESFVKNHSSGMTVCFGPKNENKVRQVECDAMVFGSLSLSLLEVGLSSQRMDPVAVTMSVDQLLEKLREVQAYETVIHETGGCKNLTTNESLLEYLEDVENSIPSPVLDLHHRHLQRQAKKLGLDKGVVSSCT
ncbi:hypothetical protein IWZ00DRAFT_576839 [Phyllosticta capitalensis]|uniref:uncharacterized protein n=1 Tax=Phyllosticta capitalensis TaxID=121624 RepID=UPI003131A96F